MTFSCQEIVSRGPERRPELRGNAIVARSSALDNVATFTPHRAEPVEQQPRVRCAFRSGDSTYYPRLSDVIWIQARRNYSHVYLCGSNFTVRELLSSIERRLDRFFRIQRSTVINLEHVTEIRRERRGRYSVILSDGSAIDVPFAVKERIESLLAVN